MPAFAGNLTVTSRILHPLHYLLMLSSIIRFSVRNKLLIGLFILGLILWGILSLNKLPIDAVPDITNNQVQVITVSPSLAAPEVERLITFPIEQATSNIPGIKEIRSFSRFGLSLVTIVFEDATDVYWARQQISERLILVRSQIPEDAGIPELAPVTTGLGEIFQYAVKPVKGFESRYTALELRTIQDWLVRRQLLGTPGVADVSSFGGFLKQYEVAVDPDKLFSLGITIKDVFTALEQNNQNAGGSYIEKGPTVLFIRTEGLAQTIDDINKIVVKNTGSGMPVLVSDVANVRIGHANRYGAMVFNDEGEVAGGVVMMLKGGNSSAVIREVKKRITQIEKNLPEGVMIEPFLDRTKMVNNAIGTVKVNLMEGALIVIFILVIFLGNLRAGLIVASVIPLSMLFAFGMMNLFGVSGNLMSLGALDFGLIVDGAVIIVEAVMHRLYHSKHREALFTSQQMDHAVTESASKMMSAAVFGQIIILIVYLPILTLVGIEGKMFRPMAETVSFALLGAFILSLTYVPMVTSLVLSKKIREHHTWSDKMMLKIGSFYQQSLKLALQWPKFMVISSLIVFFFSVFILSRMGGEFIPELEEGDFAVDTRVLTGSSLTTTIDATKKTAGILINNFPEVEKVVTKIGSGEIPTDPMPIEAADMMVILKDKKEWTTAKSFDALADTMSKALQQVPGVTAGFQFPVQMRFNELMTGARQDVVCKIFGEDLDSLALYAKQLGDIVQTVEGATDLYKETVTGLPQIVVSYNRDALAMYKLNIHDVNNVVSAAFAGQPSGKVYENERRFDVVVRIEGQLRTSLEDIQQLLIPTPTGMQVPLSQVAEVAIREGPNQIQREDAKRRIVVGFNVRGRDVQTIVEELQDKVDAQLKLSPGYYVTYGGQFENLVQARNRLSIAVPLALLLIFFMLYFAFGSFKHGLLVFSAIPLSAIGGILALWIRGMPFSISAGIGFIALFGVAVLNGIVLISEFNRLRHSNFGNMNEIIMEGTRMRLRPVLMTAAVASLGFLPMALSNGAGAEVQRPLATVVIGGLVTATALTLLLLPVLYAAFNKVRLKKVRVKATLILVLMMAGMVTNLHAQTENFTLDELVQKARLQNLLLRSGASQVVYWEKIKKAAVDLPKTSLAAEYGNINSMQNDTRFQLTQGFSMPVVYKRQAAWYDAGLSAEQAQLVLTEKQLTLDLKNAFISLVDLLERKKLLQQLDSLYSSFADRADIRLQAGETVLLEKASAGSQLQQHRLLIQQVETDIEIEQRILKVLINEDVNVIPVYEHPAMEISAIMDTSLIDQHPEVKMANEQWRIASADVGLERNRLLPDFNLGYANQSIIGWQSTNNNSEKYYSGSTRFHIVQGTINIPIFARASKARVNAAKAHEEAMKIKASHVAANIRAEVDRWMKEYLKWSSMVKYYQQQGREYADLIISQASLSLDKGAIDYLQWSMLINQALNIRLNGIDAIRNYNQSLIHLQYYLPENH